MVQFKQKNLPAKSIAEAKSRGLKTFMGMDKSGMRTKELAAVTREDLTKVGLDPSKKSSLTKYLNMKNKTGKTPTKSDFAPKSNLLGDAMKKQDTKRIQKNIQNACQNQDKSRSGRVSWRSWERPWHEKQKTKAVLADFDQFGLGSDRTTGPRWLQVGVQDPPS